MGDKNKIDNRKDFYANTSSNLHNISAKDLKGWKLMRKQAITKQKIENFTQKHKKKMKK